jgi:hypothetical protein
MKDKLILSVLFTFTAIHLSCGQIIKVEKVSYPDIVKFANESHIIAEKRNDFFASIRIITLGNLPGSAGYSNGEITENIYVAVSEYGEMPDQNLFCISEFYSPKFVKWDNEKAKTIDFIIRYGPADNLKTQRFEISLDTVKLK